MIRLCASLRAAAALHVAATAHAQSERPITKSPAYVAAAARAIAAYNQHDYETARANFEYYDATTPRLFPMTRAQHIDVLVRR